MIVAALGGEGGGVFTNWIIKVADVEGWLCQTTYLAGVAQRTGATIYYLELFPRPGDGEGAPVMSLFPSPGDVDIAVASEISEAGRMVQRGFVTRDRTTLITSSHRVYDITEKIALGDGTVDGASLQRIAETYAKNTIQLDMLELAREHDAIISAVMLGAVAGAGVLPFSKASFEQVIRITDKDVETNLAVFEASFQRVRGNGVDHWQPELVGQPESVFKLPAATTAAGSKLLARLEEEFPSETHEILYHGLARLVDYQDYAYAESYLHQLGLITALDDGSKQYQLTNETGRWLALWMSYEDIPRVAQLKTRQTRFNLIRREVRADDQQLIQVTEFFRPRIEEMCALMPVRLGQWVVTSPTSRRFLGLFTAGRRLRSSSIWVYLLLSCLAGLRRFRRGMLGYYREHELIGRWLAAVLKAVKVNPSLAYQVAECGCLIKGYGDTRQRTSGQVQAIVEQLELSSDLDPQVVAAWRESALQDDGGKAFDEIMVS